MIDTIWSRDMLATVPGSVEGLSPLAVRIYDWLRGTCERDGKPVPAGDVARLFGKANRVTERHMMPQDVLAELVDASLVYIAEEDPGKVAEREQKQRAHEIRRLMQGGPL